MEPDESGSSLVALAMMTDFTYCLIQQVIIQAEAKGDLPVTPVIDCSDPDVFGSLFQMYRAWEESQKEDPDPSQSDLLELEFEIFMPRTLCYLGNWYFKDDSEFRAKMTAHDDSPR
jgi:hypothetical protein